MPRSKRRGFDYELALGQLATGQRTQYPGLAHWHKTLRSARWNKGEYQLNRNQYLVGRKEEFLMFWVDVREPGDFPK